MATVTKQFTAGGSGQQVAIDQKVERVIIQHFEVNSALRIAGEDQSNHYFLPAKQPLILTDIDNLNELHVYSDVGSVSFTVYCLVEY